MQSSLNAVGQTYNQFIIRKYLPLTELQSTLIELVHEPTGARVLHIANDDPENLFCLSFQTFPSSSNGVAHILEHTVLCGSKKFPVKDPFFAMNRRSLNTYMNALTGQDFTCYPASSLVENDFYHLLEVYLDAVFHPELKRLSFLQEGVRLEFTDPQNLKGPVQFQGIVYNEMKGAMSSLDSRLWAAISKHLCPDLPYAHNSGGDPEEISNLTYDELVAFHREFYHPSRCLFFFYGNLPLAKHLDFIAPSLKNVPKIAPLAPLPHQKRYKAPLEVVERIPVAELKEKQAQIAFSWLTVPISHQNEILALCLLDSILTDTDASPLTKAFLKSGLCTQVDSSIDIEMSEIPWTVVCKGCEEKDADRLQQVLFETLKNLKISPEQIEASLHQMEFQRSEIGSEGVPFGLTLFMRAALPKQHGSEPENALLIHSLFADLKNRLQDPMYLNNLVQKYLIHNTHLVRVVLRPDPQLEQEEREKEQKKLAKIRSELTEEQEREIANQSTLLAAYQEEIEHQSLDCLPNITLKDIPPHGIDFPLIEKGNTLQYSCFTNQILHADLVFDLPELKAEDLTLVSLFSRLLPELGCGGRSYEQNLDYQQLYVGNLDAALALHIPHANPNQCRPSFSIRGKALYRNQEPFFQLVTDFVKKADLNDKERIAEWLSQHATHLQNKLSKSAMNYAVQGSLSGFSIPSFIYEQWFGIPYYQAVQKWVKHCDDSFIKDLKRIADMILGVKNWQLVLTCDESLKVANIELPNKNFIPWSGQYALPKRTSSARIIAAPVAFTSLGMRTVSFSDVRSSSLLIATELMQNLILHKEIREKGGAYGSGATYTPSSGEFHFYSYRDPHLSRTVAIFEKAIEKIGSMKFNDRELEEAKLGVLQTLDAPISPGSRGRAAFFWKRSGRTYALREEFRKKMMAATKTEVAEAVQSCLQNQETVLVSYLGQELLKKEQNKLKTPLPVLPI